MKKRMLSLLLALVLALTGLTPVYAAPDGGTFYLTASTAERTLIEPVEIPYTAGQTVLQALQGSGYAFELSGGFVTAIDGQAGNYTVFYDGGAYALDAPASEVKTAIVFSEYTGAYDDAQTRLAALMGRCRAMTNNVLHYKPAADAYADGLAALRSSGWAAACTALEESIAAYEAILNGPQYTVTAAITRGDAAVPGARLTLTDSYGNVTSTTSGTLRVVAGDYTFTASDGSDRTEGKLTVTGDTALDAVLPNGEWFGAIQIMYGGAALPGTQDAAARTLVCDVPDMVGKTGLCLYAKRGADIPANVRLRTIFVDVNGNDCSHISREWDDPRVSLFRILDTGMEGRTFALEARYNAGDCTQIQSYAVTLRRTPTLSRLAVTVDGVVQPMEFVPDQTDYTLPVIDDTVVVEAAPYDGGYTVAGSGTVRLTAEKQDHTVSVTAGGRTTVYTLHLQRVEAVSARIAAPSADTAVCVTNAAGAEITPTDGVYRLLPGASYTCTAAVGGVYRADRVFTASAGLSMTAPQPERLDALTALALYDSAPAATRKTHDSAEGFSPDQRTLTYTIPDNQQRLYMQATVVSGYTAAANYYKTSTGRAASVVIKYPVSDAGSAVMVGQCVATGDGSQTVTVRLSKTAAGVEYYQEHTLHLIRRTQLKTMSLRADGEELRLCDASGALCTFRSETTAYTVTVPKGLTALSVAGTFVGSGYTAEVNGIRYDGSADVEATLDPAKDSETVTIRVCGADSAAVPTAYTVTVRKQAPVNVTFAADPADATVFLTDTRSGKRIAPTHDNVWSLMPGVTYRYTVTCHGCAGVSADYTAPDTDTVVPIRLTRVAGEKQMLDAAWPSFRANGSNNGVVSAPVPASDEQAMLSWATQLGEGYGADACGCPILVDGCLYTYARSTLYKVDAVSGQVLATGAMDHSSSFAINTPTYAEGMIFVGLSDGTIQAFDAVTLRSAWIYRDPLKGQPNSPIVYHDGYIYTGFWNGEEKDANYVCLSVTDEDPTRGDEAKLATWTYTSKGGFYWAGAYACDTAVVVPTDDGANGYVTGHARLLSLSPKTGFLQDAVTMAEPGDLRSAVTYDNGQCYFTSKGGYFYRIGLRGDGTFEPGSLRGLKLYNYANDAANPAMSTSTPTVYNGRAYVGVSGVGQFKAYSGHNITVIDLTSWRIAYTVRTQGYPQTSALLTTAYEAETGYVYVYFFDNFTPGKLRLLRDQPGQTAPDVTTPETIVAGGQTVTYDTAPVLFTPSGAQQQYAICSPITDESGTIYFKNDSAFLMALTSTITKLEITAAPDKTAYREGESFDPAGMQITAHYANGYTRDVTKYVTWSTAPLTAADTRFRLEFPYAMYQNADGKTGVACVKPSVMLSLTISALAAGDVNGDGVVDDVDAALVYGYVNGRLTLTDEQLLRADVNVDGLVDQNDAAQIYAAYLTDTGR